MVLGPKLARNFRVAPSQELSKKFPAEVSLASNVKGLEAIPCILQTVVDLGVRLAENLSFNYSLGTVSAHNSEVLAVKLLSAALAPNSNDLLDTNVQEMLQELVQGVICVAAIRTSCQMGVAGFVQWLATYMTKMGPSVASALWSSRTLTNCTPTYDFPVPGGPWMRAYSRVKATIKLWDCP